MDGRVELIFLGTGTSQGVPVVGSDHPVCLSQDPRDKRLRTSALVRVGGKHIVIDCGPDFRQQMLRYPIPRLDALLFTHEHADHTHGVDDVRPFYFRQGDIPVYACDRTAASIRERFGYIFETENRYPGAPAVEIRPIVKDVPLSVDGISIEPIQARHHRIEVFGFRFGNLVYLTDVKTMDEDQFEKIKGADILVVNALRIDPHPAHMNLEEALDFVERAGAGRTYFTHISHLLGFHEAVQRELPEGVYLAHDGLAVTTGEAVGAAPDAHHPIP